MFQTELFGLWKTLFWTAQVPIQRDITPAQASLITAGPRFFVALIAGVILAFAIQFVLTNLSVAAGITYLGHQPDSHGDSNHHGDSAGGTMRKIGTAVGLWTVITVTVALAFASFLAVKLSLLILSPGLGAILGLVIWGAYFLLLVWVSSTTVGSLVGSVVNTASSGLQAVMGTATAALGAKAVSNQVVSTAEAAAAAVRREFGNAVGNVVDPAHIRENVEDYLDMLRPPELDLSKIRGEFEKLINDPQLKAIAGTADLANINRDKFVELVSSRTDLSKRDLNRITDTLHGVWQQVVSQHVPQVDRMGELMEYVKSIQPGQDKTDELSKKIDQLAAEMHGSKQDQKTTDAANKGPIPNSLPEALSAIAALVMGRGDLPDFDVEKILGTLNQAKDKVSQQAGKLSIPTPTLPFSPIRADVENYLHNTYAWQLSPEKVAQEFRDVLYDPAADPVSVKQELERLNRNDFVNSLQQRGLLTQAEIKRVADQLEEIRKDVLATVVAAAEREAVLDMQRRVESYLLVTNKANLTEESIEKDFKALLQEHDADEETTSRRLAQFNRQELQQILAQRNDLQPQEVEHIVDLLLKQIDHVLIESKGMADQAKYHAETLWLNLESYLRNTGKEELNPQAIQADIKKLLNDPQAGVAAIQARLSRFDRDTLVKLLSQRQDLNEAQVQQILHSVEDSWQNIRHAPQVVVDKAKAQYDSVTTTLADYLRNTGKSELNPEGIQRDFAKLFNNPQEGAQALRQRLSQVDRDTLVKLLSQRQDMSAEQVNQVIDSVLGSIRDVVRTPRRLAMRTQQRVQNFGTHLEEYLLRTGKQELNPAGIKRDLQLLLHDPRVGMESLSDRLSHFDRSTLISLLKLREDLSDEEAARIVDQVLGIREHFVEQVRSIQRGIQDVIDGVFARIRNYLNALDRPELNYDGIKRDVRQLFYDPQAGFDAMRDRLHGFNRDTLVALMSSRDDISEEDANRVIDQVERARNSVLQRAERVQLEAQRRLDEVKHQAQRQAEETRKAAASAAWWLFTTAVVSAFFAALAGAMAIVTA